MEKTHRPDRRHLGHRHGRGQRRLRAQLLTRVGAAAALLGVLAGCAALFALAGCAGEPPATAVPFPERVGAFARAAPPVQGHGGVTGGYQQTDAGGGLVVTVQVRPAGEGASLLPALDLGRGDSGALTEAALGRSLAQIRRFYPAATVTPPREVLLVRDGVLRNGRGVTVEYQESLGEAMQAVRLEVIVLCCTARHELVEYRFRHAAGTDSGAAITAFLRGFAWRGAEQP